MLERSVELRTILFPRCWHPPIPEYSHSRQIRIRPPLGGRSLAELLRPHLKERAYD